MGRRLEQTFFPKKIYRWPTSTLKGAKYHSISGKFTANPQCDITSHLSECLSSKIPQIINIVDDIKKTNPSIILVGM